MTQSGPQSGPDSGQSEDVVADAVLAARLLVLAPQRLGGIALRGDGPAREVLVEALKDASSHDQPWRRLPGHIDDERLLGGIDLAASLAGGTPVRQSGLLDEVQSGFLCVPMAERLRDELAGKLVQAMDQAGTKDRFALILLDDAREADECPPHNLADRVAFSCDLSGVRLEAMPSLQSSGDTLALSAVAPATDEQIETLAQVAFALGVESVRPLIFALEAAKTHAALNARSAISEEDLTVAARLVLAPRATRLPQAEIQEQESAPETQNSDPSDSDTNSVTPQDGPLDDVILEAVLAAIPDDVLAAIADGRMQRRAVAGGTGRRTQSKLRGRPLGARPGLPRGGARLALIDSLRAAAPWQGVRRRDEPEASSAVLVRKDDLRVRRFEERAGSVTVFCVDASGSAAAARLAEAKGAVELILAQAYVKRSEVALVAFRGEGAEVLLPPTRSLTRARRALAGLPGGGGTPLASGITTGLHLADSIASRGRTPFLVFLTDGSANVAADGTPGRAQAQADAEAAAKQLTRSGYEALLIDISPRPRPAAEAIARTMHARYMPLPMADAVALERTVSAAQLQLAGA